MQKQFVFFFGKNPGLSLAELACYNQSRNAQWAITPLSNNAALVNGTLSNPTQTINRLGGTTQIAQLESELTGLKQNEFEPAIPSNSWLYFLPKKFVFNLSSSGLNEQQQFALTERFKAFFKKQGYKASQKTGSNRKTNLTAQSSPTEIQKWNLLENQTDLIAISHQRKIKIGYTIAAANPKDWKFRDEKRPQKDSKETISIRLAKILLNLSATKPIHTLLDPFCGYGTILQEALLQNWNAVGIESDEKKAKAAEKNLRWIESQYKTKTQFKVITGDAQNTNAATGIVDAIATEPYLGPYWHKKPLNDKAEQTIFELQILYQKTMAALAPKLERGQRIALVSPVIETLQKKQFFISPRVFEPHFKPVNPLAEFGAKFANAFPFVYQNPNNVIQRQIWVLEKK